ncbi:hypothetical protein NDU88_005449 [Pleurodeles waltl]|uniref:Uncharacterized protein n=1 Tax=Pleurodeles waltl TaxID=8319 RepID=A0AAV7RNB2_PLEWA|nr:hypothetical protein NDU88_005449 [Pleurodeles waltl]
MCRRPFEECFITAFWVGSKWCTAAGCVAPSDDGVPKSHATSRGQCMSRHHRLPRGTQVCPLSCLQLMEAPTASHPSLKAVRQRQDDEDGRSEDSQLECSAYAPLESHGGDLQETERPCRRELTEEPTKGPSEWNEKYNLRLNPPPSQRLRDFMC